MVRQAHAAHILVKTEDQARDIQKRLQNGEDFGELAHRLFLLGEFGVLVAVLFSDAALLVL